MGYGAVDSGGASLGARETFASIHTPWVRRGRFTCDSNCCMDFIDVICDSPSCLLWFVHMWVQWWWMFEFLINFWMVSHYWSIFLISHVEPPLQGECLYIIGAWRSYFNPYVSGLRQFWPNMRVWGYNSWWVWNLEGSGFTSLRCGGRLQESQFDFSTEDFITFWTFGHTAYGLFFINEFISFW